jgi:hypothetical protein
MATKKSFGALEVDPKLGLLCYLCRALVETRGSCEGRDLRWGMHTIWDPRNAVFYPCCDKCWGEKLSAGESLRAGQATKKEK